METQRLLVRNKLSWKITSFSVDKIDNLKRLFQILQERCYAAGEIEISNFKQMEQTDEVYEQNKRIIKEGFELKLTVTSLDGQELWGE
jgi:DNA-directed RNA polymerase alpha subunit